MPALPSPKCGQPTLRPLQTPGHWTLITYYLCESCWQVWTVRQDGTNMMTPVTPIDPEDPDR